MYLSNEVEKTTKPLDLSRQKFVPFSAQQISEHDVFIENKTTRQSNRQRKCRNQFPSKSCVRKIIAMHFRALLNGK